MNSVTAVGMDLAINTSKLALYSCTFTVYCELVDYVEV